MSTDLEKRSLSGSSSSFPALYETENGLPRYDSKFNHERSLKPSQSVQSLPVIDGTSPLDYRTLLLQKRNSIKKSWQISESDSDDSISDSSCDDSDVLVSQNGMAEKNSVSLSGLAKTVQNKDAEEKEDVSCPEKLLLTSDSQVILKVSIPEQTFSKCLRVEMNETAWSVKQRVMQALAVKLPDPLNYGLFSNDLGCFFQEQKRISEYVNNEQVAFCELRYKTRVYHHPVNPGGESRRLCKMQGEQKRKELMRYVRQHNVEKLCKLLNKGVDPNFHTAPNGETPLTTIIANYNPGVSEAVAFEYVSVPLIKALVSGGAHFDFRNQLGFSPLHVAVRNGNAQAVKTLLSLGAPSDSYDNSELTPLYHCSLSDSSADCIAPLFQHGASITCVNSQKWNILHQICRHGRLSHLEVIVDIISTSKGAEVLLDMQNESGNTALHMCAIYNQQQCLLALLNAGIDKDMRNYSHQDAFQVAVVARNMNIANLIRDFPKLSEQEISLLMHEDEAEPIKSPPSKDRNIIRRHTFSSSFLTSTNKNSRSLKKRGKLNPATLRGTDIEIVENSVTKGRFVNKSQIIMGSTASTNGEKQGQMKQQSNQIINENPYDVATETVYEMAKDSSPIIETNQTSFSTKSKNTALESENNNITSSKSGSDAKSIDDIMMTETGDVSLQSTSHPDVFHRYRDVVLSKGREGYGFVLRGAKADKSIETFAATARHPGLQYLESVEAGSNAHRVGLRAGDYILKINAIDVTSMGHRQTVDVIRKLRDPLRMRVVTVVTRPNENDSDESSFQSSSTSSLMTSSPRYPSPPGEEFHRTASISSAMGKLDSVLAMEDDFDDKSDGLASVRRRPLSRRLTSREVEDMFRYDDVSRKSESDVSTQPVKRDLRKTASAASRLIRVLPPTVPTKTGVPSTDDDSIQNHREQNQFSPVPSIPATTPNHGTLGHAPSSIDPRKGPPLPPARVDSRLSDVATSPAQRASPSNSTNGNTFGRSFAPPSASGGKDLSGFANAIAMQAESRRNRLNSKDGPEKVTPITQHLVAKAPPSVAPKPGRGKSNTVSSKPSVPTEEPKSAFALALAAKQANLRHRGQTAPAFVQPPTSVPNSTVPKYEEVELQQKPTAEELRELMQLPPPPPVPTSDPTSPLFYNLPPPPPPVSQSNTKQDQTFLPPPPDSMLSSTPSAAPGFSAVSKPNREHQSFQTNVAKLNDRFTTSTSNGVDSGSSADSGVYEFATQPQHISDTRPSVDNLSVVSSVSTLSSEDGSDAGVSLSYDPKTSPEKTTGNMYLNVLKKNKSQQQHNQAPKAAAGVVLTKVNFTGSKPPFPSETPKTNTFTTNQPIRSSPVSHVTQKHSSETKVTEPPKKDVVDSGTSKSLHDWTTDDVCKWLSELGMGAYTGLFSENEIVGSHLPDLSKEDLQELGVTRLGHRLTIEKAVKKLTGK